MVHTGKRFKDKAESKVTQTNVAPNKTNEICKCKVSMNSVYMKNVAPNKTNE